MQFWSVPPLWPGETVFVVASGASRLGQDTRRLAPRAGPGGEEPGVKHRVVAVNSSYLDHPFADFVFSGDLNWLNQHADLLRRDWRERTVTTALRLRWDGLLNLRQAVPPGPGETPAGAPVTPLSRDPRYLVFRRTSLTGAINLACHLTGFSGRLVLLGADGRLGPRGETHAHPPHPGLRLNPARFDDWYREVGFMAAALAEAGIPVVNASPGSAYDFWPTTTLDEVLAGETGRPANPGFAGQKSGPGDRAERTGDSA